MEKLVEMQIDKHIGHITLNRPEKLNALSRELVKEMYSSLDELLLNKDVKVIILSGSGKGFCAGGDIESMSKFSSTYEIAEWIEFVSGITRKLMELDLYVIAAVHGYAAGAGFSLALAADFIVAERKAKFAISFTNVGLIPDLGLIKLLSKRVSPPIAKEWISSGKVVTSEEALSHGIINRISEEGDVVEEAKRFAEFIIKGPKLTNKYVKYLLNNVGELHNETAFMQENMIQTMLLQTHDHKEGVKAFFEKRQPKFEGK
ncbi:MAG TPA: enoyl-CoA hydratase/isomerase family protein [Bacilli bacterium]|nr:enoyl-CoA hydratase/isomerase family protein [Bacilli bacterium]